MSLRLKLIFVTPIFLLVLAACNLPVPTGTVTLNSSATPDLVQTLTAMAPTEMVIAPTTASASDTPVVASPTAFPTAVPADTQVAPTNTTIPVVPTAAPTQTGVPVVQITPIHPLPTAMASTVVVSTAVTSNATRINFASNATSTVFTGSVNGGQMKEYLLRVLANQVMMVNVDSPNHDAYIAIYGLSGGQVLLSGSAKQSTWQGRVPSTQDYVIRVLSPANPLTFTASVIIPENIVFQPGAFSASRSYPIRARETHTFLLRAAAGQTMTLKLTPSDQTVLLAFYGYQDGQPYLRMERGQTSWTGPVPASEDFVIQVDSVIDTNTNFTLDVNIH